jgi:hypothetical protein
MNNNKYNWTYEDNLIISLCYKRNRDIDYAHRLCPHISKNSIKMKYANCLYLDQGSVIGALSSISKTHEKVWNILNNT